MTRRKWIIAGAGALTAAIAARMIWVARSLYDPPDDEAGYGGDPRAL